MDFKNTDFFNFEGALRGMRNPLNSWDRSDSIFRETSEVGTEKLEVPIIGEKDLKLAQALINGGTEHAKFLRQIFVSVDITAPLYW